MTLRFSASSADRILACPSSANLEVAIPGWQPPVVDPTAGQKGRGTSIHAMLEPIATLPTSDIGNIVKALGYYHSIKSQRRFKSAAEVTLVASFLHQKPRTTLDALLYLSDELHIFDWKTGKIPVDVHDNAQLKYYALCAASAGYAPKAKGVHVHIVQPWADDNMASTYITMDELVVFKEELLEADKKIENKVVEFNVTDHCKFCPAFPHSRGDKGSPPCPAAMEILYPPQINEQEIMEDV